MDDRKVGTVVRTVLLIVALINQILVVCGVPPLPIEDTELELLITTGFTIVVSIWAWWKNNSLTKKAQQADNYLDSLKASDSAK